jgi:protein SCO1/2
MLLPSKAFVFSVLVLSACSVWAVASFLSPKVAPSLSSAVFIPKPVVLSDFQLLDHHGRSFTNAELLGRWSIIAYGYTYCPDICPTTLSTLVRVDQQLKQAKNADEINWLFYTVDHNRDQPAQLRRYLSYFPLEITGLTTQTSAGAKQFEKSLGILSQITPVSDGVYQVAHGVYLYLINPEGELQAVFKPQTSKKGVQSFKDEIVVRDYLRVRDFL